MSFIIPVLNGEKYIGSCLERIIVEKSDSDEIIVVDNGSTDSTLEIVKKHEKVKLIQFPRLTVAALRNRGVSVASGNLLAFIDSDCLVCEGWRQAIMTAISGGADAAGSHYDMGENPSWIEKAWLPKRKTTGGPTRYLPSGNLAIRKEVFDKIGGFDEQLETDEDTDLGLRLSDSGFRIIEVPEARVIHLGNPKSLTHFVKKEKWHAQSIVKAIKDGKIDKPLAMTFLFLGLAIAFIFALIITIITGNMKYVGIVAVLLLAIPMTTAVYRAIGYREYRYLFQLMLLFLIFYSIRSFVILSALPKILFARKPPHQD